MSLNVRGSSNFKKRTFIFTWSRKTKSDNFSSRETHRSKEVEKQWEREWGGKILFSHGSSNARGVEILFKNGLDVDVISLKSDTQGRFLIVKEKIEDVEYSIVNAYGPNQDSCARNIFTTLQQSLLAFEVP